MNNGFNPYSVNPQPSMGRWTPPAPHYEVIRVNGEAGARAFQMAPNSNIFLADATDPHIIWFVQTDGAGLLTPTPFDIMPHKMPQEEKANLEARIEKLEELYEQLTTGNVKLAKKQRKSESSNPTD